MPRPKKAATKKTSDARVTENLRKIYENPDGSLPDMKTIEPEPGNRGWKILLRLVIVGALAVTAFLAWKISVAPRLKFNDEIAVALSGPKEVAPTTLSTYTVRYRNPGTSSVEDVSLYFEHPGYFVVTSSSRTFEPDSQKIIIGDLRANESGEVTITGEWAATVPTETTLTAVLTYTPSNFSSVFEKRSSLQVFAPQPDATAPTSTPVAIPQPVSIDLNGGGLKTKVTPGNDFEINVKVKNLGTEPITNATAVLSVVAPSAQNKSIMNWNRLNDPLDGTVAGQQINSELRRGTITWTPKEWKDLENLAPGASTELTLRLPLKTMRETEFADFATSTITVTAELKSGDKVLFTSVPAVATIFSDTTFTPAVKKTDTGYEFSFMIGNNLHPLKDALAEIELFGDFTWDQTKVNAPAGTVEFDQKTKTVRWKIPTLPLEAGDTTLTFPLKVKANTNISSNIKFTAIDAAVNEVWSVSFDDFKLPQ